MNAVDTSVIVAAFASWHEFHGPARRALDEGPALIAHCSLETYSVLTRLPVPHRAAADLVAEFLEARFAAPALTLPGGAHSKLIRRLASSGIVGGSAYDALVGATSLHHGATLLTLDARALATYERLGVRVRQLV